MPNIKQKIAPTRFPGLSMIPADLDLAGAEIEVARLDDHLTRLRGSTRRFESRGRIRLPVPGLSAFARHSDDQRASRGHQLLIPLQCEYFALEGLSKIVHLVNQIRVVNDVLSIGGIIMTMYDARTNLSQQVVNEVRKHFPNLVYQTIIPRSVRLGEAPKLR